MHQVVKAVEQALRGSENATPAVVRLQVSSLSHLAGHNLLTLQSAFELASIGTRVEGARLEVSTVPIQACCRSCGSASNVERIGDVCTACGSQEIVLDDVPEVIVQDVMVTE
ncbi:hydrogenase/urease maturation nickel metallochaperone HypA [Petrachloros mirabilis]